MVARTGKEPHPRSLTGTTMWKRGVPRSDDLERILALPRRALDIASVPDLSPLYVHTDFCGVRDCDLCRSGPARLTPFQSAALLEAEACGGAFLAMPVGQGKTLASMLLFDALRAERGALFIPSDVRDQFLSQDVPRYGRHFRLPLDRFTTIAYTQLSDPRTPRLLHELAPDRVVADEAHALRNKGAVRTGRFLGYMGEHPGVGFAALSGTMMTKSLRDYAHLIGLALRAGSPLPHKWKTVEDFACALDRLDSRLEPMAPGALLDFCTDEEREAVQAKTQTEVAVARVAFGRRQAETRGVVSSSEAKVGASLVLRRRELVVPDEVQREIVKLESTWSIGEEEIDDAMRMAAFARQLACGFYYRWVWPNGVVDREWLDARRAWHRAVRHFISYQGEPGLDSQMLVTRAVQAGRVTSIRREWEAWDAVRERPEPPTEPVWISRFLIDDAVAWMLERDGKEGGGIVWFGHRAVEVELRKLGVRTFGAGDSPELVELAGSGGPNGAGAIACSISAHRKGKNLQHRWSRNYLAYWPATSEPLEQMIGRTHRPGQMADVVEVDVPLHTESVVGAIEAAFASAHVVAPTQQQRQKILYARKVGFEVVTNSSCHNLVDTTDADA